MKKTIFILLFCLMFVLVGCGKKQPIEVETVNVEVVDGYERNALRDNKVYLEYFVIVEIVDSEDSELYEIQVPVKATILGVNSSLNYPVGTILNVEKDKLLPYEKKE